ncbi:MAG TPA: hypothetical protein VFJ43_05740 [Bacteroidia bacterium]|nr:hypothetical protein [Bacteroidia bacterium]
MKIKLLLLFFLLSGKIFPQNANDTVIFSYQSHYYFTPENLMYSSYSPLIDRLGRPYIYVASKEAGLVTMRIFCDLICGICASARNIFCMQIQAISLIKFQK